MPVELHEALGLPRMRSTGAYTNRSPEIEEFVRGIKSFPVPRRITIDEAASMFEIWMQDKALHSGEVRVESESRYGQSSSFLAGTSVVNLKDAQRRTMSFSCRSTQNRTGTRGHLSGMGFWRLRAHSRLGVSQPRTNIALHGRINAV